MRRLNFKCFLGLITVFLTVLPVWCDAAFSCSEPDDSNYHSSALTTIISNMGLTPDQATRLYTASGYPGNISCAYRWLLYQQNQIESALSAMNSTNLSTIAPVTMALFTPLFNVAGIDQSTCGTIVYLKNSLSLTVCNNYILFTDQVSKLSA